MRLLVPCDSCQHTLLTSSSALFMHVVSKFPLGLPSHLLGQVMRHRKSGNPGSLYLNLLRSSGFRLTTCLRPKVPHKVLRPDQGAVHGAFNTSLASLRISGLSGLATSDNSGFSASPPVPAPSDNSGFIAPPAVVPSGNSGFNASPPLSTAPEKGVTVGIYATPVEFVDRARALQHPMAGPSVVSDSFKKALFANLTRSASEIVRARASFMDKVSSLVEKLQPAEDALHASFPREAPLQRIARDV